MPLHQSIDGCMDSAIGERGLKLRHLQAACDTLAPRLEQLRQDIRSGASALFRIIGETADIAEAQAALDALSQGAQTLVIFGTGGSSLGAQTLARLGGWQIPGDRPITRKPLPRVRFHDNLDARSLAVGLDHLEPTTTRFVVVSKSGGTAETLMQAFAALQWVRNADLADEIPRMFLGITEPEKSGVSNGLRRLFAEFGIPMLDHDPDIGGRFSVFSNVGMVGALSRGLDMHAVRAGAGDVLRALMNAPSPSAFAPALGAAAAVTLAKDKGVRVNVMMPYCDRLAKFAQWYVQLWAESLGKGGHGTTPLAALGPVDQHSQLQLFMDGPHDHFITLVRVLSETETEAPVPAQWAELANAPYLAGRRAGELVNAQQHAIANALVKAGRPVRTIDVDKLDERSLGALLMHMMLETILAAHLLGIDPFDQPAVELGKTLTRDYLSAPHHSSRTPDGADADSTAPADTTTRSGAD